MPIEEHLEMLDDICTYVSPLSSIMPQTSQCDLLISETASPKLAALYRLWISVSVKLLVLPYIFMEGMGKQSSNIGPRNPEMKESLIDSDYKKKMVHARRDQPGLLYCWRQARLLHLGRLV